MIICHVNRLKRDVFMNSDFQRICNDANRVVKPVEIICLCCVLRDELDRFSNSLLDCIRFTQLERHRERELE